MTAPAHLSIPHNRNLKLWYHANASASNAETAYVHTVGVIVRRLNHPNLPKWSAFCTPV